MVTRNWTKVTRLAQDSVRQGHPQSLQIRIDSAKGRLFEWHGGKSYRYFDVASLTKIIATTPLAMHFLKQKKFRLRDRVADHLPYFQGYPVGFIRIADLLRHHSGLQWWKPFFKKLNQEFGKPYKLSELDREKRHAWLKNRFRQEKIKREPSCVYSDLDFFCLGWLLENWGSAPLDQLFFQNTAQYFGLQDTYWGSLPASQQKLCAPTERGGERGLIQGVVHDDNAWALGGVAGHAGLFMTVNDAARAGCFFLSRFLKGDKLLRAFAQRQYTSRVGDWGLGFMKPTLGSQNVGSGGRLISPQSFGHTGFTGTSLWVDPTRQVSVVILSNRTFPTRKNSDFLAVRRALHDSIWEALDGRA